MSKVVVITGGSAGIGAALGRHLGKQGHRVMLAARREPELKAVAESIGPNAKYKVTDVTRRADVDALLAAAIKEFGEVHVWINNAGQGITRKVLELTDEDIDHTITVNLKSAIYGMQAAVPHFQQRGSGLVVNVSSFLGKVPFATIRSIYSAAKAALNSLTANLRADLAQSHPGVKVSLVLPGVVYTDFAKNARHGTPPMTIPGQTAEEVAAAIATLLENPVAELYTQPSHAETAVEYVRDVAAFEANMATRRPGPR